MVAPVPSLLFALLSRRAAWLGARQGVLAQNIANADTPGFRPHDLVPFERALAAAPGLPAPPLARTDAEHLPGSAPGRPGEPRGRRVAAWETAPSGNAVVLEEQMQKVAQTQLDHQLTTSLYARHLGMIRAALGAPAA
jgi:flagellar basal-body rod protein FlgB